MGPRLFRRGDETAQAKRRADSFASMGPRLFRRGDDVRRAEARSAKMLQWGHVFSDVETLSSLVFCLRLLCFNGATSFQTWRPSAPARAPRATDCSFNGATSFQTWRRNGTGGDGAVWFVLQWGHVFSDVETGTRPEFSVGLFQMLQWGHVFSDVETKIVSPQALASIKLQWGHVFSDVETLHAGVRGPVRTGASMGPRLFRRGDKLMRCCPRTPNELQWGHVFSDVETTGAQNRLFQGLSAISCERLTFPPVYSVVSDQTSVSS